MGIPPVMPPVMSDAPPSILSTKCGEAQALRPQFSLWVGRGGGMGGSGVGRGGGGGVGRSEGGRGGEGG